MLTPISYTFNCTCGRCHKFESLMPEEFSCKCGKTYKSKTATIKEGLLQGFKTIRFTEVTPEMVNPKEVKLMIKVNRKPVDKQEMLKIMLRIMLLNEMDNKFHVNDSHAEKMDRANGLADVVIKNVNEIYGSEQQGEIESIEIELPIITNSIYGTFGKTAMVKLTLEQCKEIAKAIQ